MRNRPNRPNRPVIGITLDSEPPGGYSPMPWYALRENYCDVVTEQGGIPLTLPHEADLAAEYLSLIDGLIVTGGAFDIDPELYGATERHASIRTKARRTRFEWAVMQGALHAEMPVLGICGGEQLLNVILGGSLIQHLPERQPAPLVHEQSAPRNQPCHAVEIVPGTLLHRLADMARIEVNSTHHQAVASLGAGLIVSGRATDGVIEAIEHPGRPFCLGVQWHPEYRVGPQDARIIRGLVDACRR